MNREEVIQAFIGLNSTAFDDKMLGSLDLTKRELDLLLGALNALSEGSLEIPNFNNLAKRLKISNPFIQALKQKGYVKNGSSRGKWEVTEAGIRKIAKSMQVKVTADVVDRGTQDEIEEGSLLWEKYPIDNMTLGQIIERLQQIDRSVSDLLNEKKSIQGQLKKTTTPLI